MSEKDVVIVSDTGMLMTPRTRRDILRMMAVGGAAVFLPSMMTACSNDDNNGSTPTAPGTGAPLIIDFAKGDIAILQFAYALEQLEADFYTKVMAATSSTLTAAEKTILQNIKYHEVLHREFLKVALGTTNGFTVTTTYPNVNFNDRMSVLTTAKLLEETGVKAYNGAAQYITDLNNLLLAGKIVSVEARHASAIADLLSPNTNAFAPTPFDDVTQPSTIAATVQNYLVDKLSLANVPTSFTQPAGVIDVLQFALLLEYLESDFYTRGVASAGMIPAAAMTVFTTIRDHENAHVEALIAVLGTKGATPRAKPVFDYTAKGSLTGFNFGPAQYPTFLAVAQVFEDTSVRAYKGQISRLINDETVLNAALAIHSVEARHASMIRRIRGGKGWISGNSRGDLPAFAQAIYDGEDLAVQSGATLSNLPGYADNGGSNAATEAFDEPLTMAQVTAIVTPFLP